MQQRRWSAVFPNTDLYYFNYSNNDAINAAIYLQSLQDKVLKRHEDGYNSIHWGCWKMLATNVRVVQRNHQTFHEIFSLFLRSLVFQISRLLHRW